MKYKPCIFLPGDRTCIADRPLLAIGYSYGIEAYLKAIEARELAQAKGYGFIFMPNSTKTDLIGAVLDD